MLWLVRLYRPVVVSVSEMPSVGLGGGGAAGNRAIWTPSAIGEPTTVTTMAGGLSVRGAWQGASSHEIEIESAIRPATPEIPGKKRRAYQVSTSLGG